MATIPVIDDLDRCKIALRWVAEMQSDSLTAVLELLLERLEDAIGQVHAQLRQCTCPVHEHARERALPAPRRGLTMVSGPRQTSQRPAPVTPEARPSGEEPQDPLEPGA
jgi:hypothetical protein